MFCKSSLKGIAHPKLTHFLLAAIESIIASADIFKSTYLFLKFHSRIQFQPKPIQWKAVAALNSNVKMLLLCGVIQMSKLPCNANVSTMFSAKIVSLAYWTGAPFT